MSSSSWLRVSAVLLTALIAACGAGDAVRAPGVDAVTSVRVLPGDAVVIVGDTTQLAVLAEDESGHALAVPVTWRSLDPAIATVQHGVVSGASRGVARIVATAGRLADTARVTVTELAGIHEQRTLAAASLVTLGMRAGVLYDIPDVLLVGDDDIGGFVPLQGLVTYQLGAIAPGARIHQATLGFAMTPAGVFGEPFALGGLHVERSIGLGVNLGAPSATSILAAHSFMVQPRVDVSAMVRAAYRAGAPTVTFRLRFAQHGNANGRIDQLELEAGALEVKYER